MRDTMRTRQQRRDSWDTYYPPIYGALRTIYDEEEEHQKKLRRSFYICMALFFVMGVIGAIAIATSPVIP